MVRKCFQIKLVTAQRILVFFNFFLEKLSPNIKFGKVENSTELVVTPFKEKDSEEKSNTPKVKNVEQKDLNQSSSSLYQRLFNKDSNQTQKSSKNTNAYNIIDSRTLDNVFEKSIDEDDSSESTKSSETAQYEENPFCDKSKRKLVSQMRSMKTLLAEISSQERKIFNFRAIPRIWNDSQMCDVYVSKPFQHEAQKVFAMSYDFLNENDERVSREYYVNLKFDPQIGTNEKNTFATIELNDILMAKLKISKFSRVTLTSKNTVVNFLERIDLIPTSKNNKQEILEDFKQMLIKNTSSSPLLINQGQIFKLCGGSVLVTVKLFPESFKYCLCDAEILRERKIFVSDQFQDVEPLLKAAGEISSPSIKLNGQQRNNTIINTNELVNIVEDCVNSITIKNCLSETNQLRKLGNFLILGNIEDLRNNI